MGIDSEGRLLAHFCLLFLSDHYRLSPVRCDQIHQCFAMFHVEHALQSPVQDYATARAQLVDASANNVLLDIMQARA